MIGPPKHAQKLLDANGLQYCKPLRTPLISDKGSEQDEEHLSPKEHKNYRRVAAQLLRLGSVRPDIIHAVKELPKRLPFCL